MKRFSILRKHVNISHETLEKLIIYFELLISWQKKMNLVSHSTLEIVKHGILGLLNCINFVKI